MPPRDQHIQRAVDNEDFYHRRLDLREPIDRSWGVVVLFYAALHWVDAYLATKNIHPADHHVRDQYVGMEANLRRIGPSYQLLEDRSATLATNSFRSPHRRSKIWRQTTSSPFEITSSGCLACPDQVGVLQQQY